MTMASPVAIFGSHSLLLLVGAGAQQHARRSSTALTKCGDGASARPNSS